MAVRITFLRHGHAALPEGSPVGAPDSVRRLTEKGLRQALARREQLGNPSFDVIITSKLRRTLETAMAVSDGEDNEASVIMLRGLFHPSSGPICEALNRLFEKLKHSPLRAYLTEDGASMMSYGCDAWVDLQSELDTIESEDNLEILVVGHGMYLALMVHCGFPEQVELTGCLMDVSWGECDGFVVELDPDDWSKIKKIEVLPPIE